MFKVDPVISLSTAWIHCSAMRLPCSIESYPSKCVFDKFSYRPVLPLLIIDYI